MKFCVRLMCIAVMAVVTAGSSARADMVIGDFKDASNNLVGQIELTLNGNGTIHASVTETTAGGIIAVGINSVNFIMGSGFVPGTAVNTMVFAPSGFYVSGLANPDWATHDTFTNNWTLGAPGQFTSVLQALGGSASTAFVLEVKNPTGGLPIGYTAQAALVVGTVPEPSSLALFGLGAIGLLIRPLRRKMLLA